MSHSRENISRPHSECANSVGFGMSTGFSALFAQCAKILFLGGGVYFLKSVQKSPFRNIWVRGGVFTFLSTEPEIERCA